MDEKLSLEIVKFCPNCGNQKAPDIEYCTRCGFTWSSLTDPASAFALNLFNCTDEELFRIVQFFYFLSKNLIVKLRDGTGNSAGYMQRVMQGERNVAPALKKMCEVFRSELQKLTKEESSNVEHPLQATGNSK
jgi:hypothetical protein